MSTAQVAASGSDGVFYDCGAAILNAIVDDAGGAVQLAITFVEYLAKHVRDNKALFASQLLQLLGATWENICANKMKQKYISRAAAIEFVSLVRDAIRYESKCQESFMPDLLSREKNRLQAKIDALIADLRFEKVSGDA
uniref:Uncharacterized protein n=1 Tax=Globisporangium ultimum (strain ATCC 200006 / CBS 805.95 / DAOM BR144) TaxID=431595 RepID=K3X1V1_GLOUD